MIGNSKSLVSAPKKEKIMKNILILLAFIPTVLFGQIDRSKKPEPQTASLLNIKDSEVFTLSNGITVILSENHKLPRVSFDLGSSSNKIKVSKVPFGLRNEFANKSST
mgnify:CR=1 FL=1